MPSTSKFKAGVLTFSDAITDETIMPLNAVFFEDDFLGPASAAFPTAATAGTNWCKKLVQTAGTPVVGNVANYASGAAKLLLDSTSEEQEATLYWLDALGIDTSKAGGFEVSFFTPVIPTLLVQAAFGVQAAYVKGPDNNTVYARGGLRGGGNILFESKDGTTTNSVASSTTITTTTEKHVFRMDWNTPGFLTVWIDGNNVSNNVLSFAPPSTVLQPYLALYKASGAGVGQLGIDYFRTWTNRV